jgi:hypothetical protein
MSVDEGPADSSGSSSSAGLRITPPDWTESDREMIGLHRAPILRRCCHLPAECPRSPQLFCPFSRAELRSPDRGSTFPFIQKMYHDLRVTMIGLTISASFSHIGIAFAMVPHILRVRFDEITLERIDFSGG